MAEVYTSTRRFPVSCGVELTHELTIRRWAVQIVQTQQAVMFWATGARPYLFLVVWTESFTLSPAGPPLPVIEDCFAIAAALQAANSPVWIARATLPCPGSRLAAAAPTVAAPAAF